EPRQHEVEDHEVGLQLSRAREPRRSIIGDGDRVALDLEIVAKSERQVGVVFDDQYARHRESVSGSGGFFAAIESSASAGADRVPGPAGRPRLSPHESSPASRLPGPDWGSSTTTRAPHAGASPTHARPPCSDTNSATTASPIPLPATAELTAQSRRW